MTRPGGERIEEVIVCSKYVTWSITSYMDRGGINTHTMSSTRSIRLFPTSRRVGFGDLGAG